MQAAVPFACFLSLIRPPGVQFENSLLQIVPVDKSKCPFVRDHTDISFQLFTRHNPTVYEELTIGDDEKLFASSIDLNDQTVFYFHAFMEQPDDGSGILIREAYMQRGDANVIMIDAHQLEAGPWYFTAAQNTWYIGNFAAQFIDYLVSRGLDLKKTHLVGHSLGAQSAGVAGASLKTGRVSRITGLDPALPLFDGLSQEQRLDSTDADFVDVIHTDAGIFGVKQPLGHVDFYPNGGQSPQPGCELKVVIPEQLFLNTCDGHSQTRGYYTFFLQPMTGLDNYKEQQPPTHYRTVTNHNKNDTDINKDNAGKKEFIQDVGETDIRMKYIKGTVEVGEGNHIKTPNEIVNIKSAPRKTTHINRQDHQDPTVDRQINFPSQKDTNRNMKEILDNFNERNEVELGSELSKRLTLTNDEFESDSSFVVQELETDIIDKDTRTIDDFKENNKIIPQSGLNVHPNYIGTFNYNTQESIINNNRDTEKPNNVLNKDIIINYSKFKPHVVKRDRRSLSLFNSDDNLLFRILNFLTRNRKKILPVLTVMREINTLVRSGNGELNNFIKERNNYIGAIPSFSPVTYNLELGSESSLKAFLKKLLGLSSNSDRLTITSTRR